VLNTLAGERYKIIPNEIKNYVRGLYGRSPAPLEKDFIQMILGDEKPITHRPADDLEPMLPKATENLDSSLIEHEEDIISYCLFPEQALEFFKWRKLPPEERPISPADLELAGEGKDTVPAKTPKTAAQAKAAPEKALLAPSDYDGFREIMQTMSALNVTELSIRKGDVSFTLQSEGAAVPLRASSLETIDAPPPAEAEISMECPEPASDLATIDSPLVGKFYSTPSPGKPPYVTPGEKVEAGRTVCIVEAMKLINEIKTTCDCKVVRMLVQDGESVDKGQPLVEIEEV